MGVYPSYGGVEKVSTVLANAFVKEGCKVSIVSFEQPHPDLAEKELSPEVHLYTLNYPVGDMKNVAALHSILQNEQISIIINQWALPFAVTRLCRKAMKGLQCKLVSVYHNVPNTNKRIKDIELAIEQKQGNSVVNHIKLHALSLASRLSLAYNIREVDRMVVLSKSFIPIIRQFAFARNASNISCITNPVTIDCSNADDFSAKENEIVYVGRIEYNQKRNYRLVEVWQKLQHLYPNWRLTIVGDGPDAADMKQRIAKANLQNIRIEGFKNPLPYYQRTKIIVLTSEYEGFPLVLAEAMSNGVVPVVLGSYSAAYDIVRDGAGIVSKMPFNAEVYANEISALMGDDERLRMMSEKAREVAEEFSLPMIKNEWFKLFNML